MSCAMCGKSASRAPDLSRYGILMTITLESQRPNVIEWVSRTLSQGTLPQNQKLRQSPANHQAFSPFFEINALFLGE